MDKLLIWDRSLVNQFIDNIFIEMTNDEIIIVKLTSRKKYGKNIENAENIILHNIDLNVTICHTINELKETVLNYGQIIGSHNVNQLVIYVQLNKRSTIKAMFDLSAKINEYASKLILLKSNEEIDNTYNKIRLLDIEYKSILMKSQNGIKKYLQLDIDFKDSIELEYEQNNTIKKINGIDFTNRIIEQMKFLNITVKSVIETKNGYHIIFLNDIDSQTLKPFEPFNFYNFIKLAFGTDFCSRHILKKSSMIDYLKDGYCQIPGTYQACFPVDYIKT